MAQVHQHVQAIRNIWRDNSARILSIDRLVDQERERFRLSCSQPNLSTKRPPSLSPVICSLNGINRQRYLRWHRIVDMKIGTGFHKQSGRPLAKELPMLLVSGYEKASKLTTSIQTTLYEVIQELARCTFFALNMIDLEQPIGLDMASQLWSQLMKNSTKLRSYLKAKADILDHRKSHLLLFIERNIRNPFQLRSDSEHLELLESAVRSLYEIFDSLKRLKAIVTLKRSFDEDDLQKELPETADGPIHLSTVCINLFSLNHIFDYLREQTDQCMKIIDSVERLSL